MKSSYKEYLEQQRRRLGRADCPYCGARHYWRRIDRQKLEKDGETRISCKCGEIYWVVMNIDRAGTHIRANRKGSDVLRGNGA